MDVEEFTVKDLMVPISEYATVALGTTLLEAIQVLEEAQEAYDHSKYQHRAILVLDNSGQVIGKISQLRVLKAIEPKQNFTAELARIKRFNFSDEVVDKLREQYRLKGPVLDKKSLKAASSIKVDEFMMKPSAGEFIDESASMDAAIHKLVAGKHLSLLVSRGEEIVGVLRMPDVFASVFHAMKSKVEE